MASSDSTDSAGTSATINLVGKGLAYESVSHALHTYRESNKALPKKILLAKNSIGVDGTQCLANDWLKECEDESDGAIETLSMRSNSVGRFVDPSTGAYVFSNLATAAIGKHGHRLMHLDLGWNDVTPKAIETLVKGLLAIKAPEFDADSFNPNALTATRSCALASLELQGNSIGDESALWLTLLLKPRVDGSPSQVKYLGLMQCAIEEAGGRALAPYCGHSTPGVYGLEELDVRENDFGEASAIVARAGEASVTLRAFSGLACLNTMKAALKTQSDVPIVTSSAEEGNQLPPSSQAKGVLVAGPNSMCHGVLALLLALRPFVLPRLSTSQSEVECAEEGTSAVTNPLSVQPKEPLLPGVILDLRGSTMCGFYQERTEAVDELISLLSAQHGVANARAHPPSKRGVDYANGETETEAEVVNEQYSPPLLHIHTIELDDASGLTPNQVKAVFAACRVPKEESTCAPATTLKVNGEVMKDAIQCSVQ